MTEEDQPGNQPCLATELESKPGHSEIPSDHSLQRYGKRHTANSSRSGNALKQNTTFLPLEYRLTRQGLPSGGLVFAAIMGRALIGLTAFAVAWIAGTALDVVSWGRFRIWGVFLVDRGSSNFFRDSVVQGWNFYVSQALMKIYQSPTFCPLQIFISTIQDIGNPYLGTSYGLTNRCLRLTCFLQVSDKSFPVHAPIIAFAIQLVKRKCDCLRF